MDSRFRQCICTSVPECREAVWSAVGLWIAKPHLVNRRLCGIEPLFTCSNIDEDFQETEIAVWHKWLRNFIDENSLITDPSVTSMKVRNLIPRTRLFAEVTEAVLLDEANYSATFIPLPLQNSQMCPADCASPLQQDVNACRKTKSPSTDLTYRIVCDDASDNAGSLLHIDVLGTDSAESSPSEDWLRNSLAPKLVSWSKSFGPDKKSGTPEAKNSLRLVSVKKYAELVQRLKMKYGKQIVRDWSESTDPHKFVSEDIGIAAYLLALWQDEQERTGCGKQSFVDLGCGNGLLVHLLSCEGHSGLGIDTRQRKIWDKYGVGTELVERTLDPSGETLPHYDWIIGNHSDELTPWIPYIASRSSYTTKFFLLPCCAFDFNHKFNKPGNESEYQAYFKYLRFICSTLGFDFEEDTLRIPSTKRKCFIGRRRLYPAEEQDAKDSEQTAFLTSRLQTGRPNFVIRSSSEPIRNCTTLSSSTRDSVITAIVNELLRSVNRTAVPSTESWNAGGVVLLSDLMKLLSEETVSGMKNQCGGLQTFIRNNQHIFEVYNAEVRLRNYADPKKRSKKLKSAAKTKPCWFSVNHPDGCPLDANTCLYIHPGETLTHSSKEIP